MSVVKSQDVSSLMVDVQVALVDQMTDDQIFLAALHISAMGNTEAEREFFLGVAEYLSEFVVRRRDES